MRTKKITILLSVLACLIGGCANRQNNHDKQGESENLRIGGADSTTQLSVTDNLEMDSDTLIYELPQCQLWKTEELLAEYKGKPIEMWTEYKTYREDVAVINVFVTNPTDIPLDFGRRWNLYVWKDEKYDTPELKVPYLMWEEDLFISKEAPLLYCFRFSRRRILSSAQREIPYN